jgi:WD40 repeat protein
MGVAPDGELLATIPFDGPVKLWDLAHSRKAGEFTGAISGGYDGSGAVFSPDGQYLAVSLGGGGALSLWRLSDGAELWRGGVAAAQFSPDGSLFAYADFGSTGEGLVILRSAHGQQVVRSWETGLGMVWRILFSLDGRLLATTDGQQARLWQVDDGRLLQTWRAVCP